MSRKCFCERYNNGYDNDKSSSSMESSNETPESRGARVKWNHDDCQHAWKMSLYLQHWFWTSVPDS